MSGLKMAKAGLHANGIEPGTMPAILVDLSGRTYKTRVPYGVDKITIGPEPIGSFVFVRTDDRDPFDGAPIFRQPDPTQQQQPKGTT